MLELSTDCFSCLFNVSYPSFENIKPLFLTCKTINLISNKYINDILKKNYKLIIRDNYLNIPKQTYGLIYKIYGDKFVMCKDKLSDLAIQSVITNNMELLKLLHKNASNTMKSIDLKLFKSALDIKSLYIINYLIEQHPILEKIKIREIIKYYYSKRINSELILKSIIDKNDKHKQTIMRISLKNNDLDIFKLFVGENGLSDILNYALSEPKIFNYKIINSIIYYYYDNKVNLPIILETIINTQNTINRNLVITKSLINNDLNTIKLCVDDENSNEILVRAIKISNIEATIYIMHNFEYDENMIKDLIKNKNNQEFMNQRIIDVLATIELNKNMKYL